MGLYRDARRVLLHTGLVVSLSIFILRVLLGQHRQCRVLTIEEQVVNVQRWQKARHDGASVFRYVIEDVVLDEEMEGRGLVAVNSKPAIEFCPDVTGAGDVLFIIKTGATEALDRLPVHIKTTLRCWPHSRVFSDFAEDIDNITVHDALDEIDLGVRLHHPGFDIWRHLNAGGRQSLIAKDLSGTSTNEVSTKVGGNLANPGWKIDKYKNLPMVEKSLREHPDLKWYIFTDADTFISPRNLMTWLHKLDHTKPLYLGNPTTIGSQTFGHGGSGYILSAPAMSAIASAYASERSQWDNFAAQNWAGDHIFGTMLHKRLDIPLTWAYPLLQSESPFALDFTEKKNSRKLWCYPAVSYHHASPTTIEALWELERRWTMEHTDQQPMRHRDVFRFLVQSRLKNSNGIDWDNDSGDLVDEMQDDDMTFERCRLACERNSTCLQYSFLEGQCRTSGRAVYGRLSGAGVRSGWLSERIHDVMAEYDDCHDGRWILS